MTITTSRRVSDSKASPKMSKNHVRILSPTTEKVNDFLKTIGVQPQIAEMKRLGKFIKERAKSRTLVVKVSTEHQARMFLAKSFENRDKFGRKCIYHVRYNLRSAE